MLDKEINTCYAQWANDVNEIKVDLEKIKIFIVRERGSKKQIEINFDTQIFSIIKERKNLKYILGPNKISYALQMKCQEFDGIYPDFIILNDTLQVFYQVNSMITPEI